MSLVQINWHPDAKQLRTFGLVVLAGFVLLAFGAYLKWESWTATGVLSGVGLVLGAPALTGHKVALPGYWLWMGVAFVLGNIMSRLLLALVWYLVVTPIGLLMRAVGRDPLRLKAPDPAPDTYWVDIELPRETARYERQF